MTDLSKIDQAIENYKIGYIFGYENHPKSVWSSKIKHLGYKHGYKQYKKQQMHEVLTGNKHHPIQWPNKRDIRHIFEQHGGITND